MSLLKAFWCFLTDHKWEPYQYTSSAPGEKKKTCKRCGTLEIHHEHEWRDKVLSPSEQCKIQKICKHCGEALEPEIKHQWEWVLRTIRQQCRYCESINEDINAEALISRATNLQNKMASDKRISFDDIRVLYEEAARLGEPKANAWLNGHQGPPIPPNIIHKVGETFKSKRRRRGKR